MLNIYNYIIVGGFAFCILLDSLTPARVFAQSRWWKIRGVVSAALFLTIASYAPFLWSDWMGQGRLIDASGLPFWAAVPLAYVVMQFCVYWWHRIMHESDTLWRVFHQMHHSVERMDAWGALYHSPLDMIGFTFVQSFAVTVLLGVEPGAAAVAGVFGTLWVFFTHSNIKTPQWLGHVMARPENHGVHHERGRHADNYAELLLWDRVFGTWVNPREWNGPAGFYDGASLRVWEMLTFRDVSEPRDKAKQSRPALAAESSGRAALGVLIACTASAPVFLLAFGLGAGPVPA